MTHTIHVFHMNQYYICVPIVNWFHHTVALYEGVLHVLLGAIKVKNVTMEKQRGIVLQMTLIEFVKVVLPVHMR
jgi:hypothetical protein